MNAPNVLFLVWDACRLDAAREHAPNLNELAEGNVWFDRAVTAGGWSHPSHMSMFTGEYPHEHGYTSLGDLIDSVPLVRDLNGAGYTTYGVSANPFASTSYGFATDFDTFYHTRDDMVFPEAFDVREYMQKRREREGEDADFDARDLIESVVREGEVHKSVVNLGMEALAQLTNRYPQLQRIPHERFAEQSVYAYRSTRNTDFITDIFDREAAGRSPFFVFSNYMDPHWPYSPPDHCQRYYFDRPFSYRELLDVNEEAKAVEHLERVCRGEFPDEDTLETIRKLYYGEVRAVDEQLGYLLRALERQGLYEDTLVVIVSDHGENLGETDELGENNIGHQSSGNDALHRVPMLVAHPDLDATTVDDWASTRNIADLLAGVAAGEVRDGSDVVDALRTDDGMVFSEFAANGRADAVRDDHPDIDFDLMTRDLVVGYTDDWKAVATSTDGVRCWHDGAEADVADAPEELVAECHARLEAFGSADERGALSGSTEAQLKNLGYL